MSLFFVCLLAVAVDGDTLRCANITEANGRVRLARIDAAEMGTPGGEEARAALAAMIAGQDVSCVQVDATSDTRQGEPRPDRYGRLVARCSVAGSEADLGAQMISAGQAVRWPKPRRTAGA